MGMWRGAGSVRGVLGHEEMGRENLALPEHLCHDIYITYTARRMDHRTS